MKNKIKGLKIITNTDNEFYGKYKKHSIHIQRVIGESFYIQVIHPSGEYDYDGYWSNSEYETMDNAIIEALNGSELLIRK